MLKKQQENSTLYYDLEELYLMTQCSLKGLSCDTVLQEYQNHVENNGTIPDTLMEGDACMDCAIILPMWSEACEKDEEPPLHYDFWWSRNDCNKTSADQDILKSLKLKDVPDSLAECPKLDSTKSMTEENSMLFSLQNSSSNDSAQFSHDDLSEDFQDDSKESIDDYIISTPDLDKASGGTERGSTAATDTPLDAVQSAINSIASGQDETLSAKVSYKRIVLVLTNVL